MPLKKKKKFIDKKNALSFHLVHRSQRDPLQASDEASQRVLLPVDSKEEEKRKEEQMKYGIFFEDDYDYMQHLRDTDEAYSLEPEPKIQLPSSVFASDVERDVGVLNEAFAIKGPRPDWDPDIVEGLDDDFDFENPDNQLEDDFIIQANSSEPFNEEEEYSDEDDIASDEADMSGDEDMHGDYGDRMFMDEETKSRFTNYSMSSSVIRRNEGLTLLDDRFEKLYEQYDDSEIGALDHEDIDGNLQQGSHMLDTILEEFEKQQEEKKLKDVVDENERNNDDEVEVDSDNDTGDLIKMVVEEPKEKWDCESILSTYSNLYNHPKLIEEPKKEKKINLTAKIGVPDDVLHKPGFTRKQIEQEMRANLRADRASTYRPKDETNEEKKSRKKAVKEERQVSCKNCIYFLLYI
ncbi:hypothetical protein KUTeg_016754 [Tegillarca granosa]|uniref:Protein LTV1 homolog n=1 Tax=Tegillarca granosa TaxID=220873 RepID=A0ABQ9EMR4_TEGGR|nr:hypothetical protein KUTeg_016754 [Tegillarca granosa]